jgi:hypothetical protein
METGTPRPHGMDNNGTRPCVRRSSEWGFSTGGGRETRGRSGPNGAKKRADVDGGDEHSGDWVDFPPRDRGPRRDFTDWTRPRSSRLRSRRVSHGSTRDFKSTKYQMYRMWGTTYGGLPGLHSGGMLVLCKTQGVSELRYLRGRGRSLGRLGGWNPTSR